MFSCRSGFLAARAAATKQRLAKKRNIACKGAPSLGKWLHMFIARAIKELQRVISAIPPTFIKDRRRPGKMDPISKKATSPQTGRKICHQGFPGIYTYRGCYRDSFVHSYYFEKREGGSFIVDCENMDLGDLGLKALKFSIKSLNTWV